MGTKKAILKATPKATAQDSQVVTTQSKTKQPTVTIGAFSFIIDNIGKYTGPHAKFSLGMQTREEERAPKTTAINTKAVPAIKTGASTRFKRNNFNNPLPHLTHTKPSYSGLKFIKPQIATAHWQQVVRKEKKTKKCCFFCQKPGHIQRHCWKKIKCYKCGRFGHKFIKCFYKNKNCLPFSTPPSTIPKSRIKDPCCSYPPSTDLLMEPIHVRPITGAIYRPPRQNLNEENDYLCTVGLIILIRGHPAPNLPRLIAAEMAVVHGGRPVDYAVNQATIAPYLIICPNMRVRDQMVQRGIYSIPNSCTQFVVHEWRPRFGMGHDPCTHQVWVRITGLPLQAWTVPEISDILQEFGHPLHILPFGREAGHYRDITALVATKDPSNVPMACFYREGDYSVRIEIAILSSRLSQPGYFPPPNDPQHEDSDRNDLQLQRANRPTPQHRSASSSSDNTPSEPTIDLSSWSPRSHRMTLCSGENWVAKSTPPLTVSDKLQQRRPSLFSKGDQSFAMIFRIYSSVPSHLFSHKLVTVDPITKKNIFLTQPLLHLSLLDIPSPIPINLLAPLTSVSLERTRNRENSTPSLYPAPMPLQSDKEIVHTVITLEPIKAVFSSQLSPIKVNKSMQVLSHPDSSPAQTPAQPYPKNFAITILDSPLLRQNFLSTPAPCGPHLEPLPSEQQRDQRDQPSFQPHPLHTKDQSGPDVEDHLVPEQLQSEQQMRPKTRHTKGKAQATRRSERLRQRQPEEGRASQFQKKSKTQGGRMAFNFDSNCHHTPLDTSAALQVLQATGMTITDQIEAMVDEAVRLDQQTPSMPTTPIHDIIPPLALPGLDMLL